MEYLLHPGCLTPGGGELAAIGADPEPLQLFISLRASQASGIWGGE